MRPPARASTAATMALLLATLGAPAAADELALPCDDLAPAPPAQGVPCGTWTPLGVLPMGPREGLEVAALHNQGVLLAFGGRDAAGVPSGALWAYHVEDDTWEERASGPPRADAAVAVDSAKRQAFLFGGRDAAGARDDVWRYDYDSDTWTQLPAPPGPTARYGAASGWNLFRPGLVLFGGTDGVRTFAEHWSYQPDANRWDRLPDGPPARSFASGTWDEAHEGIMFSGGTDEAGAERSDTWFYSTQFGGWAQEAPSPEGRTHAATVWDFRHATLQVFGGVSGGALSDVSRMYIPSRDLWVAETDAPSPRRDAAGAFDREAEVSFVAGGRTAAGVTDEFWGFKTAVVWSVL